MDWIPLESETELKELLEKSSERIQAIFKHSTRCPLSRMVKSRLEKSTPSSDIDFYYLDLLKYRPLSNQIAAHFNIRHESPQIILVRNGKAFYNEDHSAITPEDISENSTASF